MSDKEPKTLQTIDCNPTAMTTAAPMDGSLKSNYNPTVSSQDPAAAYGCVHPTQSIAHACAADDGHGTNSVPAQLVATTVGRGHFDGGVDVGNGAYVGRDAIEGVLGAGSGSMSPGRPQQPTSPAQHVKREGTGERSSYSHIASFSPYAARLATTEVEDTLEDSLSRATLRMAELRMDDGDDGGCVPVATAKQEVQDSDQSTYSTAVPCRRMEFSPPVDLVSETTAIVPPDVSDVSNDVAGGLPRVLAKRIKENVAVQHADIECAGAKTLSRRNGRTLVVYPKQCQLHMGGDGYDDHQESPMRLELLCGRDGALRREAFKDLEWLDSDCIKPAVITDLLRVHEYGYLQHIQERCRSAPSPRLRIPTSSNDLDVKSQPERMCSTGGTDIPPPKKVDQRIDQVPTDFNLQLHSSSSSECGNNQGTGSSIPASTDQSGVKLEHDTNLPRNTSSSSDAPAGPSSNPNGIENLPVSSSMSTIKSTVSSEISETLEGLDSRNTGDFGQRFTPDPGYVDVDTRVSRESYMAATMGAGAVINAVDRVVQGKNPNAFVAVRPPGHHAGPCGSVPSTSFWKQPGMNSSGFCLINNAAVGAAYARSRYGRSGEVCRVAIVDIDIHHGNGTEEIVRCVRPVTTRLPLPSSWPPMTKTIYKPWLDEQDSENVFFGSVSLQDKGTFYPASGTEEEKFDNNPNIVNVSLSPLGPPPGEEPKKRALTKTKMQEYMTKAGTEFRTKCAKMLLPKLKEFSPDLLLISAGFDGHVEDYYHYLSNDCYQWITRELASCVPSGRVVSVLEGGYSVEARPSKTRAAQQARANSKRQAVKPEGYSEKASSTSATVSSSTATTNRTLRERRHRPATRGQGGSPAGNLSLSATSKITKAGVAFSTSTVKSEPEPAAVVLDGVVATSTVPSTTASTSASSAPAVGDGVSRVGVAAARVLQPIGNGSVITGDVCGNSGKADVLASPDTVTGGGANAAAHDLVAGLHGSIEQHNAISGSCAHSSGAMVRGTDFTIPLVADGRDTKCALKAEETLRAEAMTQKKLPPAPPLREEEKKKRSQRSRTKNESIQDSTRTDVLAEALAANDGGLVSGVLAHVVALSSLAQE